MAPFSIPTPSIIPLRLPIFGGPKSIDTDTKIQILCETYLEHEIFYTIDGTKPQPYAGIVQGNKTIKYTSPFCLPAGKITIKAMAINSCVHTMCSSVVTKCFEVLKIDSEDDVILSSKVKQSKSQKFNKNPLKCENKKIPKKENHKVDEKAPSITTERLESDVTTESEAPTNCLEEAFIGSSDFELESREEDTKNENNVDENALDNNNNLQSSETVLSDVEDSNYENDFLCESVERSTFKTNKTMDNTTITLTDSGTSIGTQFCCMKCDLTLQQCSNCQKMNAVSSKFCIGCGEQLLQMCYFCKEWNLMVATFCQFCGKKLGSRMEPYVKLNKVDQSNMAKPELKDAGVHVVLERADKSTQTLNDRNSARRSSSGSRRMLPHSPGRGYWHQQLDYICNHLKTHAYNNVEFRREISEPSLCDFKAAHITRDEKNIVVSLSFTPFNANNDEEEKKSNGKEQEST